MEAMIGFRNFTERRFIEISRQIDELRQLLISITLKQELQGETSSPWQPVQTEYVPELRQYPAEEINLGPAVHLGPALASLPSASGIGVEEFAPPSAEGAAMSLGEVTDQNFLTVLGRALDLVGWTDEQADSYSLKTFGVPHWDELGRSQAERLIEHLIAVSFEEPDEPGQVGSL
jgi:hypothetical protein